MSKDTYKNNTHTRDNTPLLVERFYINDIPVCNSWYGCDKHPTEACMFLRFRKFGCVPYCLYLGQDCNDEMDVVNRALDDCPLHKGEV